MCWKKLKGLFGSKKSETRPAVDTLPEQLPKEQPLYKLLDTSRGGPNAPKYQPCPLGHGWKKRVGKALGGALYYCNWCKGEFLVPYPRRASLV